MEGVVFGLPQPDAGMVDHSRPMGVGDHLFARRAHGQGFASAGIARVLVGLHDAGGDEQVRFKGDLVDRQGNAAFAGPQVDQGSRILRLMIHHPVAADHLLAELDDFFFRRAGAVHADAAQQGDIFVAYAGGFQFSQERRDHDVVRAGTGDVGKHDTDGIAGLGDFPQARGAHRFAQGRGHRRFHVRQGRNIFGRHHVDASAGRGVEFKSIFAVGYGVHGFL